MICPVLLNPGYIRYGPWSTIYSRFHAWSRAGVFQKVLDALIVEAASRGQVGLELVSVDSTIVRAHHESAGLAVAGETLDALEQALTEEKGAPLPEQVRVLRVIVRRPNRARAIRAAVAHRPVPTVPLPGGGGKRGRGRLGLVGPEAD